MGKVMWSAFVIVLYCFVLIEAYSSLTRDELYQNKNCEPLEIYLCQDFYNQTIYPNLLKQNSQEEAAVELQQFIPLIKINCSPHLKYFLCLIYAPMCNSVQPCRRLCELAKHGCSEVLIHFGFSWPFECEQFPDDICIIGIDPKPESNKNDTSDVTLSTTTTEATTAQTAPRASLQAEKTGQSGAEQSSFAVESVSRIEERKIEAELLIASALNHVADGLNNVAKAIPARKKGNSDSIFTNL